LYTSDTHWYR